MLRSQTRSGCLCKICKSYITTSPPPRLPQWSPHPDSLSGGVAEGTTPLHDRGWADSKTVTLPHLPISRARPR